MQHIAGYSRHPTDSHPHIDARKIEREVGWTPQVPLSTTLGDLLAHIRRQATPPTPAA